jgi:hypothetical protein
VDTGKVLLGWLVYVGATTGVYWLLFNGKLGHDGELPAWLIAAAVVMAIAAIALLIYWAGRLATGGVSHRQYRVYSGFFWMILVTGVIGDILALGAEIVFGASALWLMIPISTVTYAICAVWLYHRYFKPRSVGER